MGKIVMPKNSASVDETEAAIRIYYEAGDWMSNADFIDTYKKEVGIIGDDSDSSAYTKKSQIGAYYGFIEWKDINSKTSSRRITARGRAFWEHINSGSINAMHEDLMQSFEEVTFGRNNYACQTSDSDIEIPNLFLRASIDLDYLTNTEFAFLLYEMADAGKHYTDTIKKINDYRKNDIPIELHQEANKYKDAKSILILERWGVLVSNNVGGIKKTSIEESFYKKYSSRLNSLKIYNVDKILNLSKDPQIKSNIVVTGGENILYYGVPGAGKSYKIDDKIGNCKYERVVFHPDYTYADFVGQIMPKLNPQGDGTEKLSYKFVPGPFTKALKAAEDNKDEMFYLVIEEINRGNAPAIFGDIFQLLDRNEDGSGKYYITNFEIAREVYKGDEDHQVKLPSNLTIFATMNTSDQNVFTLDTAFQRRWQMKYVENDIANAEHANEPIEYSDITWEHFATVINEEIVAYNADVASTEDKQLGAYFIKRDELKAEKFPEKALKYLWDDAFKLDREHVFDITIRSIGDLMSTYTIEASRKQDPLKRVMKSEVYNKMLKLAEQKIVHAEDMDSLDEE